ncbi:hypothetical protein NQ317_005625, partial [Molorchus minor]
MGWLLTAGLLLALFVIMAVSFPAPQGSHGAPQAGIPQSTPSTFPMIGMGGVRRSLSGLRGVEEGGSHPDQQPVEEQNGERYQETVRCNRIDFFLFLGNAEVYIMLALLIGLVTVIIGCWLSGQLLVARTRGSGGDGGLTKAKASFAERGAHQHGLRVVVGTFEDVEPPKATGHWW